MANKNLTAAKMAKKDEFYTRREDIEAELKHYEEHFRGKVVYCNCDDPVKSEFWQFFVRVFKSWGLKKLIATHYEPDARNYSYMLEMNEGDDWKDEPKKTPLPCNGDFRSASCIELLKQADIVVTNPPFSLFREYVAQLMEYGKKFLIIGNINAITYKEFFPLLKENKVWVGYSFNKTMLFRVPEGYRYDEGITAQIDDDYHYGKVPSIAWFTNLDIEKRHQPLKLRGNYYDPELYPHYDNYDAINVDRVCDIPCDYDGVMGVPITFFDSYCPEQFEIIGMDGQECSPPTKHYSHKAKVVDGARMKSNTGTMGCVIRENGFGHGTYFDVGYPVRAVYKRILIRRRIAA